MPKCPFCGSEDLECLSVNDNITKNYEKTSKQGPVISTKTGVYSYPIVKAICLDCGYVFQKMSDKNLEKFRQERAFFTD